MLRSLGHLNFPVGPTAMSASSVVAWIECRSLKEFEGAFVAETVSRDPAKRICSTAEDARNWIESEAAFIAAPVKWLEAPPIR